MSHSSLTRRQLAQRALVGTLLLAGLAPNAQAQVVDPTPAVPPALPLAPTIKEDALLIQLIPFIAGYALTPTQAKEAALQLKDYPGSFAKARAYALPDDVGPAFAADAPTRKGRAQ